jgi:predicted dienelactone hydrolase
MRRFNFISILILFPAICFAQNFNIGEKTLSYIDSSRNRLVKAEIWYPTNDADINGERITDLPFILEPTIRNANFVNGLHPLILLSHGTGANRFGLAWLAVALAKQGYIVIAPDHWGNTFDNKIPEYFVRYWERSLDISFLITQALNDKFLSQFIDKNKIGAAGFSFGGYTSLALAGVEVDCGILKKAALTEGNENEFIVPEFGDLRPLVEKLHCDSAAQIKLKDARIKAFIALSPALGAGIETMEQTKNVNAPVLIIGAENDTMTFVRTNARKFHALIPSSQYIELKGKAGHYTFLNIGNESLRKEAPLLFTDDASVNREEVHNKVIDEVTTFLRKNLLGR